MEDRRLEIVKGASSMKALLLLVCLLFAPVLSLRAQSPSPAVDDRPIRIQLPNSDLTDVLKLYSQLSKRKVWIELGVTAKISIFTHRDLPRAEALSLIRGTLLQDHGIEIRDVGESEAFVTRTADSRIESLRLHLSPSPTAKPKIRGTLPRP
jgi:hypothetical protein